MQDVSRGTKEVQVKWWDGGRVLKVFCLLDKEGMFHVEHSDCVLEQQFRLGTGFSRTISKGICKVGFLCANKQQAA